MEYFANRKHHLRISASVFVDSRRDAHPLATGKIKTALPIAVYKDAACGYGGVCSGSYFHHLSIRNSRPTGIYLFSVLIWGFYKKTSLWKPPLIYFTIQKFANC